MKIRSSLAFASALILGAFTSAQAAVESYTIDSVHSSVGFSIRHNIVGTTKGNFTQFSGVVTVDRDNLEASKVEATMVATSINTGNEKRDTHLRSPDFFDVATYPNLTFKSKQWKKTGDDAFDVTGDLTIHGVTKEVVLKVSALGFGNGMRPGTQVAGWEATTKINRRDFGVNGPSILGKVVGDDVTITISVEADSKS
jgi:polyisoprenoid-binding protein YceI